MPHTFAAGMTADELARARRGTIWVQPMRRPSVTRPGQWERSDVEETTAAACALTASRWAADGWELDGDMFQRVQA